MLVESEITCDDWTTVEISQNKLKLTGQATTFTSVRFVVADGAILRVDTAVEFTGDQERRQGDGLAPAFLEVRDWLITTTVVVVVGCVVENTKFVV